MTDGPIDPQTLQAKRNALQDSLYAAVAREIFASKMTVEQIAAKLGKKPYVIRRWLSDREKFDIDEAALIAAALGGALVHKVTTKEAGFERGSQS